MTKNMSWTGTHPAVDLWAEARQERDDWQRAQAYLNTRRTSRRCKKCSGKQWLPPYYEDRPSGRYHLSDPCPVCNPGGIKD